MTKIINEQKRTQTVKILNVQIEKDFIDDIYSKVMREIQKDFVVPGFRKGKVPFNIIESKLGQGYIFQKVVEEAVNQSIKDLLASLNFNVVSILNIKLTHATYEKIEYEITLEIEPIIEIDDNIELEVNEIEINKEEELKKRMDYIKEQYVKFVESNEGIKEGNRADIIFEIRDANTNELLSGGDNKVYSVIAKKELLLPGLFENILGMKKEEEKEFIIQGPDNIDLLKNRTLKVKIKINNVFEKIFPTDEELIKLVNYSSIEELKNDLDKVVSQDIENLKKDIIFNRFLSYLKEKLDFELPETMLKKEIENQKNNFLLLLKNQNRALEDYLKSVNQTEEDFNKQIENIAKDNIKRSIILNNLIRKYNINVDNVEIEYYLKNDVETQRFVMELSQLKLDQNLITQRLIYFVTLKKLKEEIYKRIKVKYIKDLQTTENPVK
ncbi:MAG: trigger factor [bacterium]